MSRNTRLVLIALVALALPLLFLSTSRAGRSASQDEKSNEEAPRAPRAKAHSVRASNFAESTPVRDIPVVEVDRRNEKKFVVREKEREKEDEAQEIDLTRLTEEPAFAKEINEKNRELIRRVDPDAPLTPDAALSSSEKEAKAPVAPKALGTPSVSFEGISIADTIAIGQGFLPPDTNGEVGPNHYVQSVNSAFRIWDKNGTALTPVTPLSNLFAPLGTTCSTTNDGDPIVLYDQLADRWMISQFCTVADPNNHQLIAVSKTGDPTGAYYLYDFMMPNNKFNDYPHFGMWPDAYYMTDNQFNQAGTAFQQAGIFAFNRAKMLVGDPTANFVYFDTATLFPPGGANGPDGIGGMLPADLDGYTAPPAGAPCPFAYFQAGEFGDPADRLRIFDFHVDFTTPANSTFTERTGSPLTVAAFDPVTVPNSRNVIPQPAPATASNYLDAINDRLMFRLAYRNFGTHEALVANHTVNAATNPTYRAGVRLYQLRRTSASAAWTIDEQTTWAGGANDTTHRWMGSAAQNYLGDLVVGYSASSTSVFPSLRYAARLGTDPGGSGLAQGEQTIIAGAGSQTSTSGRWGDYSDMSVDPVDDCTFWFTSEYYPVSSEPGNATAPWHTRIAKFAPAQCAASPRGTISGTITNCDTGLPVSGAIVQFTGGYSRATNAQGQFSATLPPGTYNVTVTGTGYDSTGANGVVVSNGGTATFNGCLHGTLKQVVADGSTITAESCALNNALDPSETVTVSFGLKNTGTSNTSNLVATLQATGGVSAPSGPQNYGVLVAGGPTVTRSFTFDVDAISCGSTVTATLNLQDGATNLGTVVYNFTTGTLQSTIVGTGNITTAIPDNATVDIPIAVSDTSTLSDVNVSVRLNHTFDGDLALSLVHPDGTVVALSNNRGGSGDNYGSGSNNCSGTPTVFDDQAATAITAGAAPFAGTFKPEGLLSAFNGKAANGTWKLRVTDSATDDTGVVGCVQIQINKRFSCCGPFITAAPPATVASESITPANSLPDPNETVTMNFPLKNTGTSNTSNLVATLQATGGVAAPSGPQTYGVVTAGGANVSRPFTFTVSANCGSQIVATLALQDGLRSLGTITYTIPTGVSSPSSVFTEAFDGVTAPALPANWTSTHSGGTANYVTSVTTPNSAPNAAFAPNNTTATTIDLVSPTIPAATQLTFKNLYNLEASSSVATNAFDGLVLEISFNNGTSWADIITAGGSFVAGGYNRTISAASNTLNGRACWSGLSGGTTAAPTYITTTVNLPSAAATQSFKLRWRVATDSSVAASGASGVRLDNVAVTGNTFTCATQSCTLNVPANIVVNADPNQNGAVVNYPAPTFTGACGVVTSSPASGSFFPIGTTTVTVTGTRADSSTTTNTFTVTVNAPPAGQAGLQYYPLAHPVRLLDTRSGQTACDTPGAALTAGIARTEAARITCDGLTIPATAQAIVGNATVVNNTGAGGGFVTLYPSGATRPTVSNLNYVEGQVVPNAFTVGLGTGGGFDIYATSGINFIVDVTGYYAPPGTGGLYYHPLPHPVRLLDTRSGQPACDTPGAPITGSTDRTELARTTCSGVTIPATAQAIVGNATVVNNTGSDGGFVTLYPSGATRPTVSNLNYSNGQVVPNAFTVGLGPDGSFNIFPFTTVNFIVDVTGYYSNTADPDTNGVAGLLYYPLDAPVRLLDTRAGQPACDTPGAPITGDTTRTELARTTCSGVTIPATAQAVVGNATVVNIAPGTEGGFVTLYPSGAARPTVSNLNYVPGQIVPNAFTVGLGGDGAFNIYPSSTLHFIVDMTGYFAPQP